MRNQVQSDVAMARGLGKTIQLSHVHLLFMGASVVFRGFTRIGHGGSEGDNFTTMSVISPLPPLAISSYHR